MESTNTSLVVQSWTTFQQEHSWTLPNNMVTSINHVFSQTTTLSLAQQQATPVWQEPFAIQPLPDYNEFTNVDMAGGSALVVGAVYLFSFMYYHYILEQEQSKARLAKFESKKDDTQINTSQDAMERNYVIQKSRNRNCYRV